MNATGADAGFADHFSAVATQYALARPDYPRALFEWIATIAPAHGRVWEAGCGSGQATAGLAAVFAEVHATDPSAQQIAQAPARPNVHYAVEPAERCSLDDASVDAVCVAQALHWFERPAFFAECARVLRPGGVLAVWGYRDIEVPEALRDSVAAFAARIRDAWPAERALVDRAYADIVLPFEAIDAAAAPTTIETEWPLTRMLDYFSSYSAVKRHREAQGIDPVAIHAPAMRAAWSGSGPVPLRWPLFVHARRKS